MMWCKMSCLVVMYIQCICKIFIFTMMVKTDNCKQMKFIISHFSPHFKIGHICFQTGL